MQITFASLFALLFKKKICFCFVFLSNFFVLINNQSIAFAHRRLKNTITNFYVNKKISKLFFNQFCFVMVMRRVILNYTLQNFRHSWKKQLRKSNCLLLCVRTNDYWDDDISNFSNNSPLYYINQIQITLPRKLNYP